MIALAMRVAAQSEIAAAPRKWIAVGLALVGVWIWLVALDWLLRRRR